MNTLNSNLLFYRDVLEKNYSTEIVDHPQFLFWPLLNKKIDDEKSLLKVTRVLLI